MSAPVIHLSAEESIKKAADLMTRYNINVLLVMDQHRRAQGVRDPSARGEGRVSSDWTDLKVKDYTNIEFQPSTPTPRSKRSRN